MIVSTFESFKCFVDNVAISLTGTSNYADYESALNNGEYIVFDNSPWFAVVVFGDEIMSVSDGGTPIGLILDNENLDYSDVCLVEKRIAEGINCHIL